MYVNVFKYSWLKTLDFTRTESQLRTSSGTHLAKAVLANLFLPPDP